MPSATGTDCSEPLLTRCLGLVAGEMTNVVMAHARVRYVTRAAAATSGISRSTEPKPS